jgi:hypothetical protein
MILRNPYHLDLLKPQAREGVMRGWDHFRLEQIPFERLATEGWILQKETLEQQIPSRTMMQKEWEQICRSASDLPGFEAWAAVSGGELAAAVVIGQVGNTWCVFHALNRRKFRDRYAMHALFYRVSCDLLARENVEGIFFTVQPLDAASAVADFPLQMGLKPRAVRQKVEFHPWLRPLANTTTHKLVQSLLPRSYRSPVLSKTEGMLRFYIEGRQPMMQQQLPTCLVANEPRNRKLAK